MCNHLIKLTLLINYYFLMDRMKRREVGRRFRSPVSSRRHYVGISTKTERQESERSTLCSILYQVQPQIKVAGFALWLDNYAVKKRCISSRRRPRRWASSSAISSQYCDNFPLPILSTYSLDLDMICVAVGSFMYHIISADSRQLVDYLCFQPIFSRSTIR